MIDPRAVLAADELFTAPLGDERHEGYPRPPAAWRDQMDGACQDVSMAYRKIAATGRATVEHRDPQAIPEWVRLQLVEVLLTFVARQVRTCMHAPDPRRPQPVAAAAWKPGLVVCARCPHLLRVTGDQDSTCDRCGRVVESIHPRQLSAGPLMFAYGVCGACREPGFDAPAGNP